MKKENKKIKSPIPENELRAIAIRASITRLIDETRLSSIYKEDPLRCEDVIFGMNKAMQIAEKIIGANMVIEVIKNGRKK